MLTSRYLSTTKNLPNIFGKIQDGLPPQNFNTEHLASIGFGGSNDRAVVPLLKELKFLSPDGTPTQRYKDYRDKTRAKIVLGEAIREIYSDLFLINENITDRDREAVVGRFKSTHSASDKIADLQAMTFFALLRMADITNLGEKKPPDPGHQADDRKSHDASTNRFKNNPVSLNYKIEIHLPPTKDIEVYNAIFRSIRENLLDE